MECETFPFPTLFTRQQAVTSVAAGYKSQSALARTTLYRERERKSKRERERERGRQGEGETERGLPESLKDYS